MSSLPTQLQRVRPGTKILFATFPADGHFNPLTGLAVHLKAAGCDVRWYTSPRYAEKAAQLDIPFYPFKQASDFFTDPLGLASPERARCKTAVSRLNFDLIHAFILRGAEFYEDLKIIRRRFAFDLVIADIGFSAIPFIFEKMGVPLISIGVLPLACPSKDLPPSGLGMLPASSVLGRLQHACLRWMAKNLLFARANRVMIGEFKRYGLNTKKAFFFEVGYSRSNLVLQSGCPGFEYRRSDLSANIKFIGSLLPVQAKQKEAKPWYDERLRQYKKAILVTQGTVEQDVHKILIPTLEAFKGSDVLVIATTGGSGTVELRRRYPHPNLIIEDYIAFKDVMPQVQAYVSNGGYGGVMLAIQHGLPLVVAGVHEGKNEINARVGYFRYGVNLKTETPRPVQIRCAVEAVLSEPVYRTNVETLQKELAAYSPEQLCEHYVATLLPARQTLEVAVELTEWEGIY